MVVSRLHFHQPLFFCPFSRRVDDGQVLLILFSHMHHILKWPREGDNDTSSSGASAFRESCVYQVEKKSWRQQKWRGKTFFDHPVFKTIQEQQKRCLPQRRWVGKNAKSLFCFDNFFFRFQIFCNFAQKKHIIYSSKSLVASFFFAILKSCSKSVWTGLG